MGYLFTVVSDEVDDRWREYHPDLGPDAGDNSTEWPYDYPPHQNSKALGIDPLPEYVSRAKFGEFDPPEAKRLADAIEISILRIEGVRDHSRADQLRDIVDWLRYWAEEGESVRSG